MVAVKACPHTHTMHQFMGFDEDRAIEVSDLDAHHLPISQCVIIIKCGADKPAGVRIYHQLLKSSGAS